LDIEDAMFSLQEESYGYGDWSGGEASDGDDMEYSGTDEWVPEENPVTNNAANYSGVDIDWVPVINENGSPQADQTNEWTTQDDNINSDWATELSNDSGWVRNGNGQSTNELEYQSDSDSDISIEKLKPVENNPKTTKKEPLQSPQLISEGSKFQVQKRAPYTNDEVLLCGTTRTLYLLDSRLRQLATLQYCVPNSPIMLPYMRHIERISFIEFIPELSLAAVGSQGCAMVTLVRIVKFPNREYGMFPEKVLPELSDLPPGPITGLACKKFPNQYDYLAYYQLYITFESGAYYCYEIRADPITKSLDLSLKLL